jgi:hypothetical protein
MSSINYNINQYNLLEPAIKTGDVTRIKYLVKRGIVLFFFIELLTSELKVVQLTLLTFMVTLRFTLLAMLGMFLECMK